MFGCDRSRDRAHPIARAAVAALLALVMLPARGDDWPTFRHDHARSGRTAESIAPPFHLRWALRQAAPPQRVWSPPPDMPVEGNWEKDRVAFDAANHVAAVGGAVFLASSGDSSVYCLDAATGQERWSFIAGGPVRLAPTVADGRVYFGSDDGSVYCLSATDGRLLWRLAAGPADRRLIAAGWMASRWPVRTDVLVDGGVAYFAAGVFPHEGIYVCAADAATGALRWRNDTTPTAAARGLAGGPGGTELSPQGYLLASESRLFVPSGRALPAAFDRADGRQLFQAHDSWRSSGLVGGTFAVLAGDHILVGANQAVGYEQETGRGGFAWFPCRRIVVADDLAYMTTDPVPTDTGGPALEAVVQCVSFEPYAGATRDRRAAQREIAALTTQHSAARTALRTENARPEAERDAEQIARLTAQLEEIAAKLEAAQNRLQEASGQAMPAQVRWSVPTECASSLILAGDTLFAGGPGLVVGHDAATGAEVWRAEVEGDAQGLAAAEGALYVTTDAGLLYCFATGAGEPGPVIEQRDAAVGPADQPTAAVYRDAAEAIVAASGVRRGFCLVAGVETGRLAAELARRTELKIYGLEPDAAKVQAARGLLRAAGLYGSRVFVDQGDFGAIPYSNYFANLVVSERPLHGLAPPDVTADLIRKLKPCGGVVCVGAPTGGPDGAALAAWLRDFGCGEPEVRDGWATLVRGALPGAGSWTHQYAEPGNTACGDDDLRAPLGLLWYGDPGPDKMLSRHVRSVAPLSIDGLLLMQGNNVVMCYDAYNGLKYWERAIAGAARASMHSRASNICCNSRHMFVAVGPQCLALDVRTGETAATFEQPGPAPEEPAAWGWIATVGDLLFGSTSLDPMHSTRVFALDAASGAPRWSYQGTRITDNTIAVSGGRVLFADAVELTAEQKRAATQESGGDPATADVRMVVCLDAATGAKLWERPADLTDCGAERGVLMAMAHDGVLVFSAAHWNGHYWTNFLSGEYGTRRAVALDIGDGSMLWHQRLGYRIRPLIVGDEFIGEPWAFDLRTGQQRLRTHPITGEPTPWQFERPGHHCGCISATENLLMFRSSYTGFYDLVNDYGTEHFGAQRPGCWINHIAANGLVLIPEASSGCQCLYAVQCTLAFEPVDEPRAWGIYSAPGPHTPVRHLALNFGAPGDRRADDGTLWLSFPRPVSRMAVTVDLKPTLAEGGGFYAADTRLATVEGGAAPWLYASGARGLQRLTLPLIQRGDAPAGYLVRLHFLSPRAGEAWPPFDISLQGVTVAEAVDLSVEAGGPGRPVVRAFGPVPVRGDLEIAFAPRGAEPTPDVLPPVCALELERVPLPGMDATVGILDAPLERYNLGYWLADTLRAAAGADLALLPADSLYLAEEALPAGELTLGALLGHVTDTRLAVHEVTGAELLAWLANPRRADRLNPLSHGRSSDGPDALYYAGLEVTVGADGRGVTVALDPARRYTVLTTCPFAAPAGSAVDPGASEGYAGIPGLRTEVSAVLERSTWDVLEALAPGGLALSRRHVQPLAVWRTWLARAEEEMGYGLTQWPRDLPTVTITADADVSLRRSTPDATAAAEPTLLGDGGSAEVGDAAHALVYLRFPLAEVPGRPVMAKLRLRTHDGSASESADAGHLHIVEAPWDEATVTYSTRPLPGERVGTLAAVELGQVSERLLTIDLRGRDEVSLVVVPTSVDGAIFCARESDFPPQLIVAYEPE